MNALTFALVNVAYEVLFFVITFGQGRTSLKLAALIRKKISGGGVPLTYFRTVNNSAFCIPLTNALIIPLGFAFTF